MTLEIILRDFLVDILRGRAKNSRCLSWLRFPSPRAKARFSASSFCALTSRTAGRLRRLLVKPRSLIERCSIDWSAIGLPSWPRSRVSRGSHRGALQKIVRPSFPVLARKFGSLCAPTAALHVKRSWPGAKKIRCSLYCLGLARNDRLAELLRTHFEALKAQIKEGKEQTPCRSFTEFDYSTLNSWSKARRVIGEAEILTQGDNPRFIVTNLPKDGWTTRSQAARFEAGALYEKFYCARGDMENRIKEQQMDLFADRTSTHWMASNQLRLWFSTFAHLIMSTLQAEVLKDTELESASIGQIRLRLFKIAARLKMSARRIHIELCTAYPLKALFSFVHQRLSAPEQSRLIFKPDRQVLPRCELKAQELCL